MSKANRMQPRLIKGWTIFWIAAFFYFYDYLLRLAPAIMMDDIIAHYQINTRQFGLLDASFYYIYTPLQLLAGPLLDEYGNKRVIPIAITACILGTICPAFGGHFYWLLLSRVLIGFGSAFAFVAVLKSASDWLPASYYAFLAGLTTTLGMLGGVIAEAALPLLVRYSVTAFYLIAACLALVLLLVCLKYMDDPSNDVQANDFFLASITQDVLIVLKRPITWIIGSIGCFLYTPIQIFVLWQKSFLMLSMGISDHTSGQLSSMIFWGVAIGAPLVGWLTDFFQESAKKYFLAFSSAFSCLMMLACIYFSHQFSILSIATLLFTIGLMTGAQPLVFVLIRKYFPVHLTATSIASVNMIINTSSFAQPWIGDILASQGGAGNLTAWQYALIPIPIVIAIASIFAFLLPNAPEEKD